MSAAETGEPNPDAVAFQLALLRSVAECPTIKPSVRVQARRELRALKEAAERPERERREREAREAALARFRAGARR